MPLCEGIHKTQVPVEMSGFIYKVVPNCSTSPVVAFRLFIYFCVQYTSQ